MAASMWSQGSRWWPRNQGIAPSARCTARMPGDGRVGLLGGEHAGQDEVFGAGGPRSSVVTRRRPPRAGAAWSRTRRSSCRSTGFSACSATRVASGFFMMSQTSSLWYARTGSALSLSTPKAHLSHQYGACSACAWWVPYGFRPGLAHLAEQFVRLVDADVAALDLVVGVGQRPADLLGAVARAR